jgi:hypothetical protein
MAMSELTLSASQTTKVLLALRAVEQLPLLTEAIIHATEGGEVCEALSRKIRSLHENLLEIADMAAQANVTGLPTVEALQRNGSPVMFLSSGGKGRRTPVADR